jgi:hypothetical protein
MDFVLGRTGVVGVILHFNNIDAVELEFRCTRIYSYSYS